MIQQPLTIRHPEWRDLPQLLQLAHELHLESWYGHIELSENRVATFFVDQILNSETNFCRVAVRDGIIIGAVAGTRIRFWFSERHGTFDNFLYVIPQERGTMLAFRLWKMFREWSASSGAVELTHGVGTAINSPRADRFFRGVGMTHVGGIYKLKLSDGPLCVTAAE